MQSKNRFFPPHTTREKTVNPRNPVFSYKIIYKQKKDELQKNKSPQCDYAFHYLGNKKHKAEIIEKYLPVAFAKQTQTSVAKICLDLGIAVGN